MKKCIALILTLAALVTLAACVGDHSDSEDETNMQQSALLMVGYAKENITPTESVPLGGYGNAEQRYSIDLLDYMYATCIYLVDNHGTELVLIALDLGNMNGPLPKLRTTLAEKFGLSEQQVMLAASHTHSAPSLSTTKDKNIVTYNRSLEEKIEKTVRDAKADALPVTGMYHTITETEGLNFVRRYIMNDGSYCGDNYGDSSKGFKKHESDGDNTMQLVKFTRDGGKDVILTNFQTHPHRTGGSERYSLSSDIVGVYRAEIEKKLDCCALYFTGSSGNVNPTSRITSENIYSDHREHGNAMAQYAVDAAADFAPVEFGTIQLSKTVYVGTCNHTDDHLLSYAQKVQERLDNGMSNSQAIKGYEKYGIQNAFHATSIISHAKLPETMDVPLYAVSIGDFAMTFAPFELFAELGVQIKDASPFEATFVCCYANQAFSYMPTELAFSHGGYGPYKSNFVAGTGEILVQEYVKMLNGLHGSN